MKSRGGPYEIPMAEVAIQRQDRALLDALQSNGELEHVRDCVEHHIQTDRWSTARFCADAITQPVIGHLGPDAAGDPLIALLRDYPPRFEEKTEREFGVVTWGDSWGRRPDVVDVLLALGLSRENLERTATEAIHDGHLRGLEVLHTQHGIPLRPERITYEWLESPRFRAQLGSLDMDLSELEFPTWDSPALEESLLSHPASVPALVELGVPVRVFDGAMTVALRHENTPLIRALKSVGASVEVNLSLEDLCQDRALRRRLLNLGVTLAATQKPGKQQATCAVALRTDPELADFFRATRAPMCGFVLPLLGQDQLGQLEGMNLGRCDRKSLLALVGHPELLATVDDASLSSSLDRLVRAMLEQGDPAGLMQALARTTGTLEGRWLQTPMEEALEAGRPEDVAAVLPRVDDASWVVSRYAEPVARHLSPESAGALVLSQEARAALFAAAIRLDRWEILQALEAPDDPQAVFDALVEVIATGASPETVRGALPHLGAYPRTNELVEPALQRQDFDTLRVLAEGGLHAAFFLLVQAVDAGCPPEVVVALRPAPPRGKWRRALRSAAMNQAWSEEDMTTLLR